MVVPNKNILQLAGKTGTAAGAELAGIQQQQRCASKLAMELSEKIPIETCAFRASLHLHAED